MPHSACGLAEQELLVCTHYQAHDGTEIYTVPRSEEYRRSLTPIYAKLPGWNEDISTVRNYNDLPENAKNYVQFVYQAILDIASRNGSFDVEIPNLRYIGVGPDPQQIIKDVPALETLATVS